MKPDWVQTPAHAVAQYRAWAGATRDDDPTLQPRSTRPAPRHSSPRASPTVGREGSVQSSVARSGDDRETLPVLLAAYHRLVATTTIRTNELRALLLGGNETARQYARGRLSSPILVKLSQRPDAGEPGEAGGDTIEHDDRDTWEGQVRNLAIAVREHREKLADNLTQLRVIVNDLAPDLTQQHRVGPVKAAEIIISSPHPPQ